MPPAHLTLVIPHLLDAFPRASVDELRLPPTPALQRLLSLASRDPVSERRLEDWLFPRFGIDKPVMGDWPVAAMGAGFELDDVSDGYWLRADPVHLRADRSALILFGPGSLAITREEADALATSINEHYAEEDWRLEMATPERGYLRLSSIPDLATTPLQEVVGRHVDPFLPHGGDARRWHALLNELQMLLHAHPVNEQRAAEGRPAINSLWLWGGGMIPSNVKGHNAWCWSDGVLAAGLAQAAGLPQQPANWPVAEWLPDALQTGSGLLVLEACSRAMEQQDPEAWYRALEHLEADWFRPLLELRNGRQVRELTLLPLNGNGYSLTAASWRDRWRRIRPLQEFLD